MRLAKNRISAVIEIKIDEIKFLPILPRAKGPAGKPQKVTL